MKAQTETCSVQFKKQGQHHGFELVAAVVEQALLDIDDGIEPIGDLDPIDPMKEIKQLSKRLSNAEQAAHWISERHKQPLTPWSFPWCCEVLGFDAPSIRRGMLMGNKLARLRKLRIYVNWKLAEDETVKVVDPVYAERKRRKELMATLTQEERLELRRKEARERQAKSRLDAKKYAAELERKRANSRERYRRRKKERNQANGRSERVGNQAVGSPMPCLVGELRGYAR